MSSSLTLAKTLMTNTHMTVKTTDSRIATKSLSNVLAQVIGMIS